MNKSFHTIEFIETGKLAVLKLNRVEKRNALNSELIEELTDVFTYLSNKQEVVLLNIVGKGESFCAGADILWLMEMKNSEKLDIQKKFSDLANMFGLLYNLPQVVVTLVHGKAFGGGLGLLACSDFVISAPNTVFSFSEINLGLIPATISPYVVQKIGLRFAKQLFYTGDKFDEEKAYHIGLVDMVAKDNPGDDSYQTLLELLLTKPHHTLKSMKKLMRGIECNQITPNKNDYAIELISELIPSKETQQLFSQFFGR